MEEKKKRSYYNKDTMMKYFKTLKEIRFRVTVPEYEAFVEGAKRLGYKNMRQFYLDAIKEKIERG